MDAFPAFIPLTGRTVVVIGRGEAAEAKARLFDTAPCTLLRLDWPCDALASRLAGAALVFVALDDPAERALAADAARASGALVNLVDQPDGSDFITPAIIDRGAVVAGITTSGSAPVLASRLRQELEALWPRGLGLLARLLRDTQSQMRRALPDLVQRRAFMRHALDGEFASLALKGDEASARQALERALYQGHGRQTGRVERMVVPDSAEHLTLSQLRALGSADRLLLVGPIPTTVLAFARRDAPRQLWSKDQDHLTLQAWLEAGEVVLELHSA